MQREESAGYMTNWAARLFAKMVDRRLKSFGVTSAHLPVLFALGEGAALSQKALTELASVEQPTMAATLSRMERDRLVLRAADPGDKRSQLFSLTETAREKFGLIQGSLRELNQAALVDLTAEERDLYLALLRKVAVALERLAEK